MASLRDRDQAFLTEIAKLGQDVANDAGGSNNIQSAIVGAVIEVMAAQDVKRRTTYQFNVPGQSPSTANKLRKRSL